jgi:hypothetical protein
VLGQTPVDAPADPSVDPAGRRHLDDLSIDELAADVTGPHAPQVVRRDPDFGRHRRFRRT